MIIQFMNKYIKRSIEVNLRNALQRGKSVLLLGPRQTGKTTLILEQIQPDIYYTLIKPSIRQRYEQDLPLFERELAEQVSQYQKPPLVFIDEVQKIPRLMDIAQDFIDRRLAQFIFTGSSARKLKHGSELNLLPGRVVTLLMPPLLYQELPETALFLDDILLYGTLPGIITEQNHQHRETDLFSYVSTYLEEEIRAEALVRNVGAFARFLEIAASEAGEQLNFTRLSQDIGVADTTISNYYQILEDCLIIHRIDPLIKSKSKRRLIKSPKYLFFDLGIRRACANEGLRLPQRVLGNLFEQYIGNELIYLSQLLSPHMRVKYWRDAAGPEIDYVLDVAHQYVPIEVKWSNKPNHYDARHLLKFMEEYPEIDKGYIVCQTPQQYHITEKIIALPWQALRSIFSELE